MANNFLDLPMPAGDGAGASVDTSAMGKEKTVILGGSFVGATVAIEVSVDGGTVFQPIALFSSTGKQVINVAAQFMRVFVSNRGAVFTANADVGANNKGADFADFDIPAGDGVGAALDISLLGSFTTVVAGGLFSDAALNIEVSEDGVDYSPCLTFAGVGSAKSKEFIANWARVRVSGREGNPQPFTPSISVGATKDISGEVVAHDLAGAEHNADTIANLQTKVSDAVLAILGTNQVFTKAQSVTPAGIASAANSVAIDGKLSNNFILQVDENTTIENPTDVVAGQIINIAINQVAAFTVAWGSTWFFPGGDPVVTPSAGANDLVSAVVLLTDGAGGTGLGNPLSIMANISQDHKK